MTSGIIFLQDANVCSHDPNTSDSRPKSEVRESA